MFFLRIAEAQKYLYDSYKKKIVYGKASNW